MDKQASAILNSLPQSPDMERAALGGFIVERKIREEFRNKVNPGDFYNSSNGLICQVMFDMFDAGEDIDPLLLIQRLSDLGQLEKAGGEGKILGVPALCATPLLSPAYAEQVKKVAVKRRRINFLRSMLHGLEKDEINIKESNKLMKEEAQQYAPKVEAKEAAAGNGTAFTIVDPDPWPDPVNGADLLNEFAAKLHSHVRMNKYAEIVCVVWALLTWVYNSFDILPMLHIHSPEKRCGKSTLLALLFRLVSRPLTASNITPAAIFRTIEVTRPCLLVDEVDSFMKGNEEIRGIINCGHTRQGALVIRCVGQDSEPQSFSTWCPKALSGIGHLQDTIEDRSFKIELTRLAPGEKVDRLRFQDQWPELRQQAQRWANDNAELLSGDTTEPPDYLSNRLADNWSPLFAIARAAGEDWVQKVDAAARHYSQFADDSDSIQVELLGDIKAVFEAANAERLSTTDLLNRLTSLEERPWGEWKQGKPMTARQLSNRLKLFHISSAKFRLGDKTHRGYVRQDFNDVFRRYLPNPPVLSGTTEQMNNDGELRRNLYGTQGDNVPDKNSPNSLESLECSTVPHRTPPMEGKEGSLPLEDTPPPRRKDGFGNSERKDIEDAMPEISEP